MTDALSGTSRGRLRRPGDDALPSGDTSDSVPTPDERAAMRAFLQRCEVRLSTMHRVATALLSGAGILVLLPAVERDTVLQVLRVLLVGPITLTRGLLAVAVVLSVALAIVVLWLLVIELTRFYFHSNHVVHPDGEVFTPRFTLTGLRMPVDELGPLDSSYESSHASEDVVRLLVPGNDRARRRIDRQLAAYPGLVAADAGDRDQARAAALFELAASSRRSLVDEVTKIEAGMVRHMLRVQVIVLRYVKALLVIVVTALAAFAASAAVNGRSSIGAPEERWIAATMAIWAPSVLLAVSSPVQWLSRVLRDEGAAHSAVERDAELTHLERVTGRICSIGWGLSMAAAIVLVVDRPVSTQGAWAMGVALVMSSTLAALALRRRLWAR
ncbi:MAG: hypothetical protein ACKOAZ_09580 [Ilumatobacteraceae bacterium]